jgi:hypothetical protein
VSVERWGSILHHELAVSPALNRRSRCWECKAAGVKRAASHIGTANGYAMASGCEWHMHAWMRDTLKARRALPQGAIR